jgi:hypothetical protein
LFLKALKAGHILANSAHSNFALTLKAFFFEFEGALFTYQDTFDVALGPSKDTFRAMTRVFPFRNNALEVAFVTPRT